MDPLNTLAEVLPIFIIFPVIYLIVKASLEYATRKKLIEKGIVSEDIKHLFPGTGEMYYPSSLKWGIVLLFVGIALVVMRALPYDIAGEIILGVALIAAGVGLLLYYFIATKKAKEAARENVKN